MRTEERTPTWRFLAGVVTVVGLYQGGVPLVVRPIFGAEQRFAPALWLPSPWWWLACLAIVVVTVALRTLLLHAGQPGHLRAEGVGRTDDSPRAEGVGRVEHTADGPAPTAEEGRAAGYDALSAVVFLVGIYNGVAPFVARLVFDGDLLLAFTLRLPPPWWWITSLTVLAITVALLAAIDVAKQRHSDG